jgi:putative ABC transport system permease protein
VSESTSPGPARFGGWRLVAPLLLLFFGTASFAFLAGAQETVDASLDAFYARTRFADYRAGGGDTTAFAAGARQIDGVAAVESRTSVTLAVWARNGTVKVQGQVVGVPTEHPPVNGFLLESGRGIDPAQPTGIVVESHTATGLRLAPGDSVRILGLGDVVDTQVRGVAASPEYVVAAANQQQLVTAPGSFAVLFVPEALAQQTAGPQGITEVLVRYEPGAARATVDARLDALAARTQAVVREPRSDQPSNAMVVEELNGLHLAGVVTPALLLVLAIVVGGLALALAARAGAPRVNLVVGGIIVSTAGVAFGALLARTTAQAIVEAVDIPVTVARTDLVALAVGVLLGLMATALAAVTARAASGARHPAAVGAALALAATTFAVAAIVAPLGVVDAARATLGRATTLELVDAQVAFQTPVSDAQLRALEAVPGVARAEAIPSAVVEVTHGTRGYGTQLEAFDPATKLQRFETPSGRRQSLPAHGVLLPAALADLLHARVGDDVDIAFPGVATVRLPVAARTSDALGNLVFTTIPTLRTALHAGPDTFAGGLFNVAGARFTPGADAAAIQRTVSASPDVATYVDVAADLEAFVGALPLLRLVTWTLLGVGAVIALLGMIAATLAIAPGARPRDLAVELVVPGAVGAVLGAWIGSRVAEQLVAALDTPLVRLQTDLDSSTVAIAIGVVVAVAIIVVGAVAARTRRHAGGA